MLSQSAHITIPGSSKPELANSMSCYVESRIKMTSVWQLLYDSMQHGIPAMLLYVLESNGSSPGRQGFSMAVNANGEMAGSIGGGIMEHKFVEMVKERLKHNSSEHPVIKKQVHDKTAATDQSGMICSGDQTILFYPLHQSDLQAIENIIRCLSDDLNGSLELSPSGLNFFDRAPAADYSFTMQSKADWSLTEKLGYKSHLYIIGGGHCAMALSKLMSSMDFYIHLLDDRNGLNTMDQNIHVHEKTVVDNYSDLEKLIPAGDNHYVVVMTFGYRTDDVSVRALIGKSLAYFGVLGSKKKIEKLFSDYIAEGISKDLLQNIHAPIGLAINSRTPEEIAVSIAAEIIQVKNHDGPVNK
jgi:xanthine dehydrogenase accessory factor